MNDADRTIIVLTTEELAERIASVRATLAHAVSYSAFASQATLAALNDVALPIAVERDYWKNAAISAGFGAGFGEEGGTCAEIPNIKKEGDQP